MSPPSSKMEITRLARKEVKQQVGPLSKTIAEQRRTIAGLKREVASLARNQAFLQQQEKRRLAETPQGQRRQRHSLLAEVGQGRPQAPRPVR